MPHPKDPVKLKAWCDGLDYQYAKNPDAWSQHDTIFMNTAVDYDFHLKRTPGYKSLDWLLVKVQAWVETGANSRFWASNVMQIGKRGDLGLDQLQKPSGQLIVPPQYKPHLNLATVTSTPLWNIRAGIGYLLWGAAHFGYLDVPVEEQEQYPGLSKSFQEEVPSLGWSAMQEPFSATLVAVSNVHGHESRTKKVYAVTGWQPITLQLIAKRYNVDGDGNYLDKLNHAYNLMIKGVPKPGATK